MSDRMAEVLAAHYEFGFDPAENGWECRCDKPLGDADIAGAHLAHQAAALTAAGFGDVREAKAQAWEEAAEDAQNAGAVTFERWLTERAAAVRGEG